MKKLRTYAVLAILALCRPAYAQQATWIQQFPTDKPPLRCCTAMAYDAARGEVVLFGGAGVDPDTAKNDTWVWNGVNWTEKSPLHHPSERSSHAMAYDAVNGEIVLFGGSTPGGIVHDTWVWDGSDWSEVSPAHNPPGTWDCNYLTYDSVKQKIVLAGCHTGVWSWNGTDWNHESVANDPGLDNSSIAYDPINQNTVIVDPDGKTWIWNWIDIVLQSPDTPLPPPRINSSVAYDAAAGNVVLFGGASELGGIVQGDTWLWDGTNWTQATPAATPSPRYDQAMTYDQAHHEVVMFGGKVAPGYTTDTLLGDTWVWRAPAATPTPTPTPTITPTVTATPTITPTATPTPVLSCNDITISGSMEGNLTIPAGSTVQAGYDFTMPGSHPEAHVTFTNASVTVLVGCPDNTVQPLLVGIQAATMTDSQNSSAWLPSGDQQSSLVYQGSSVSNACGTQAGHAPQGATFSARICSDDSTHKVNIRFHYRDNSAGGWSGTKSVVP